MGSVGIYGTFRDINAAVRANYLRHFRIDLFPIYSLFIDLFVYSFNQTNCRKILSLQLSWNRVQSCDVPHDVCEGQST